MVQTWIMAGGAVSGSGSPPPRASVQLRIMGRFTGSRAARGRLSPAAARRVAAARIAASAGAASGGAGGSGVIAGPGAGAGRRWR